MARLQVAAAETMEQTLGTRLNWFQLSDDGEVAQVRILAATVDDLDVFSLHRITLNGNERYINCLRERPDDPVDVCPLCADGKIKRATPRVFLQLLNVKDNKVYIWDRGIGILQKLRSVERRIQGPLFQTVIEIERNGRKGDQKTDYSFYPTTSRDSTLTLESLPSKVKIEESGLIMSENAESIRTYLQTGDFPGWGVNAQQQPQQQPNQGYAPRVSDQPANPYPRAERAPEPKEWANQQNPTPAPAQPVNVNDREIPGTEDKPAEQKPTRRMF